MDSIVLANTLKRLIPMDHPLVLAITGASGAAYAVRLLEVLLAAGKTVHLVISPSGQTVLFEELGIAIDLARFEPERLLVGLPAAYGRSSKAESTKVKAAKAGSAKEGSPSAAPRSTVPDKWLARLVYHGHQNFMTPIASGSFLTSGMVVCPCSGSTLSGIAHGTSSNLIQRAADVHLKERRKLILVPRETPLSLIQIDNMRRVVEAGAVLLPAMPGYYHRPASLADLVDFVVARICDQLGIPAELMQRWGNGGE